MNFIEVIIYIFILMLILVFTIRFLIQFTFKDNCPTCNSWKDLERIQSSLINKLIPFVISKHYVCRKCNRTYYKRSLKKSPTFN